MKVVPFEERAVVELEEQEMKEVGGIIIPDSVKEKPQYGKIYAVGNGPEISKMLQVGDKVLFKKYAGTEFELDGRKIIILAKEDILAKLTE
ncbi:co-chaperone GroES [Myxococcota bacterium]|nr:co-chaperone GroES [Myxococcota bacterium]MBU1380284.1 co-chaperone GroES [Myxococcota bacterium]MBU1495438.1 co-chaperone GroES [Myxococcota bacterium]